MNLLVSFEEEIGTAYTLAVERTETANSAVPVRSPSERMRDERMRCGQHEAANPKVERTDTALSCGPAAHLLSVGQYLSNAIYREMPCICSLAMSLVVNK